MPRRSTYNPLATRDAAQWIVTSDMHRLVLDVVLVLPRADTRAAFGRRMAQLVAEGWQAEADGMAHGFAFLARPGARVQVSVTAVDPEAGMGSGHAFLAGDGSVGAQLGRPISNL